jgi:hypothetical protein
MSWGIGVLALIAVPFAVMKKYTHTGYPALNRVIRIISISGIFLFFLFTVSRLHFPGAERLRSWHGLWQRLFVANYYILFIVIAFKLVGECRVKPAMRAG